MAGKEDRVFPCAGKSTKHLQCKAEHADFKRKLGRRMKVSSKLLAGPDLNPQEQAPIFKLPPEILSEVYTNVNHIPSQIMLAMTCKRLAALSQHLDLNSIPVLTPKRNYTRSRSSRPPEHRTTLPLPSTVDLNPLAELLLILRALIPLTFKLCAHCLTYRPTDPSYWHTITGYERYDFWIGISKPSIDGSKSILDVSDACVLRRQIKLNICPACHTGCQMLPRRNRRAGCEAVEVMTTVGKQVRRRWRGRAEDGEEKEEMLNCCGGWRKQNGGCFKCLGDP